MCLADSVAKICLDLYSSLPKTGKPLLDHQWTVLSCIVRECQASKQLEVVALGTGTKCIGADCLSYSGDILNDSHAEVMARRGFLRYVIEQIMNLANKGDSIFYYNQTLGKIILCEQHIFHLFTTHVPCGDATIFAPYCDNNDSLEPEVKRVKFASNKTYMVENEDVTEHFTGAKLLHTTEFDLMAQDIGCIRTKPGRGNRTLSVSCSDKIARWNVLGLQGALLATLLDNPIYINSLIFSGDAMFNKKSLERAVWCRFNYEDAETPIEKFKIQKPAIFVACSQYQFTHSKMNAEKNRQNKNMAVIQPSPTSIVWCKVTKRPLEVAVAGKRQGVVKKKLNTSIGRLLISKIELFAQYLEILKYFPEMKKNLYPQGTNLNTLSYSDAKKISQRYNETWAWLKRTHFKVWCEKPSNLHNFNISCNY